MNSNSKEGVYDSSIGKSYKIKMKKALVKLIIVFYFMVTVNLFSVVYASDSDGEIYLNEKKVVTKAPIIIDGRVFLPLRDVSSLFNISLSWDSKDKTINFLNGNKLSKLTIGNIEMSYNYAGSSDWGITKLVSPPIIFKGVTYVPIRSIADELNCNITWDSHEKRVSIYQPFNFKGEEWMYAEGLRWPEKFVSYKKLLPTSQENGFATAWSIGTDMIVSCRTGDLTMGINNIYLLKNNGNNKLLHITQDTVISIKVEDNYCYILLAVGPRGFTNRLIKVNLINPYELVEMGMGNFSYGGFIKSSVSDDGNTYLDITDYDKDFQVRTDGIYIIGYRSDLSIENQIKSWNTSSLKQIRDSYGYYLLSKDGNSQKLLEHLDIK